MELKVCSKIGLLGFLFVANYEKKLRGNHFFVEGLTVAGSVQTYLPLSHQLPLCRRGSFNQSTSGSCNGLGCLQNLLLKVQALICLLFTREGK